MNNGQLFEVEISKVRWQYQYHFNVGDFGVIIEENRFEYKIFNIRTNTIAGYASSWIKNEVPTQFKVRFIL